MEWIAERRIVDAQRQGVFDGLGGRGRRLELDDDAAVPPEWRAAFRLLKNAGFVPEWVALGREIDEARCRLQAARQRGGEAGRDLSAEVAALNRKITDFNLRVPHACLQKPMLRV